MADTESRKSTDNDALTCARCSKATEGRLEDKAGEICHKVKSTDKVMWSIKSIKCPSITDM